MEQRTRPWQRVLGIFRPDIPRLVVAGILLLLTQVAALLKPWPLAQFLDELVNVGDSREISSIRPGQLTWLALALLGLHLGHATLQGFLNFTTIQVGLRGLARVRNQVFDGLLRMSLRTLHRLPAGDLIYRATWDTYAFQSLFQQGIVALVTSVLHVALMSAVMWHLNPRLALVALSLVPLLLILLQGFSRRMNEIGLAAQAADSRLATHVQQTVSNLPLLQSYAREPSIFVQFDRDAQSSQRTRLRQHGLELWFLASVAALFALGTSVTLWMGGREVMDGRLTVGNLWIFLAYLAQFYEPLNQLSNVGTTLAQARAGTQRVFEFLDGIDEVPDGTLQVAELPPGSQTQTTPAKPSSLSRSVIAFESVGFGYHEPDSILRAIDLQVKDGEAVAITGPSGSGKSTLLHLIIRFYDPTSGKITLNGLDLREFRLSSLRSHISWVPQETLLLPGTVADNIALGRPDASRAAIEAAAREANADEFIQRLPGGYDAVVGDGAVRMSVGERQRLNLARAFLKDAPILLLDEPTSALDIASEQLVLDALRRLRQNRTVVLVSHQPQAIALADRVMILEKGQIRSA